MNGSGKRSAAIAAAAVVLGLVTGAPAGAAAPAGVAVSAGAAPAGRALVNFTIPAPDYPQFYDVSCAAKGSCMAVGSAGPTSDKYLAEQWDGSSWRQLPVPRAAAADGFDAVSCPAASKCMALSSLSGQPELWSGGSWSRQPLPGTVPGTDIDAVSCGSPDSCVAVGTTPYAAVWDGTSWQVSQTVSPPSQFPNDSVLDSADCVSGTDCIAVGGYQAPVPGMPGQYELAPLAQSWDGHGWTQLDTTGLPAGAALSGVSCTGPQSCIAVGSGHSSTELPFGVAATWDGTAWTALPDPMASLASISCATAATTCVALGTGLSPPYPPVAETWNGSTWTRLPLPGQLPYLAALNALSCGGPSSCVAVGTAAVPGSLALTWDGASWRISRASKLDALAGISCAGVGRCVATGGYVGRSDAPLGLAEALTGSSWRLAKLPGGTFGSLADVSCTGSGDCVAVGAGGLALRRSLVERWDGAAWRQLPGPARGALGAVACVQADCLATQDTSAHWWNGARWRVVPAPLPGSYVGGGLTDVSCLSSVRCLAVGAYQSEPCCRLAAGHRVPVLVPASVRVPAPAPVPVPQGDDSLAESWNGTALRLLHPPGLGLGGASCVTASFCMTVGPDAAAIWDGGSWRMLKVPGYLGSPGLVAVSCASTMACLAVGDYVVRRAEHAVAALWDGTSWRRVAVPTLGIYLADVSCPSATWCVAVGYSYQGQAATQALAMLWNGTSWQALRTANP